MQWLQTLDVVDVLNAMPVLVLGWLAFFFGRTLRSGQVPLIERIARIDDPALDPALCRYTRRLTAIWTAFFVVAVLWFIAAPLPIGWRAAFVWMGAALLFIGEHRLRPRFHPGRAFPGLAQQLRDTARVWRRAS